MRRDDVKLSTFLTPETSTRLYRVAFQTITLYSSGRPWEPQISHSLSPYQSQLCPYQDKNIPFTSSCTDTVVFVT
jgi:hypothetical protein